MINYSNLPLIWDVLYFAFHFLQKGGQNTKTKKLKHLQVNFLSENCFKSYILFFFNAFRPFEEHVITYLPYTPIPILLNSY